MMIHSTDFEINLNLNGICGLTCMGAAEEDVSNPVNQIEHIHRQHNLFASMPLDAIARGLARIVIPSTLAV